jgi:hypothetical protein
MDHTVVVNLEAVEIDDWNWAFGNNAYVKATGASQPKNAYLEFFFWWMFNDPNNADHRLTITLEATLHNGTAYQNRMVPVQLEVLAE